MTVGGGQLERELGSLLDVDRFEPPEEFRARAAVSDATIHREADADFEGWWERQAAQLDWFEPGVRCSTGRTRRSRSGSPVAS